MHAAREPDLAWRIVSVRLSPRDYAALTDLAARLDRPLASTLRLLIRQAVAEAEKAPAEAKTAS